MHELDKAILKFFHIFMFGTPKQLVETIYPDFEKQYDDRESFRIIVHRRLKRLGLVKHPILPYYTLPKYAWFLDFIVRAGWWKALTAEYTIVENVQTHEIKIMTKREEYEEYSEEREY